MNIQKEKLLRNDEIGLWIENYEYIFSDFDPRPISQRGLSEDFIEEVKKASIVKDYDSLELKFLVSKKNRNYGEESIIKKRLKGYFRKHAMEFRDEYKKLLRQGSWFVFFGIIFMFITTFFLVHNSGSNYVWTFLAVLLEPAGWFLFWEGLDLLIFESKKKKPNMKFYVKMSNAKITFMDY
jgi:hypothetical protein